MHFMGVIVFPLQRDLEDIFFVENSLHSIKFKGIAHHKKPIKHFVGYLSVKLKKLKLKFNRVGILYYVRNLLLIFYSKYIDTSIWMTKDKDYAYNNLVWIHSYKVTIIKYN